MATKYYVTVNKEGVEKETGKYDLITTRKADYTKFAKNELKNGGNTRRQILESASFKKSFSHLGNGQSGNYRLHELCFKDRFGRIFKFRHL